MFIPPVEDAAAARRRDARQPSVTRSRALPPFLQMSGAHTGCAVVSPVCRAGGDSLYSNMLYWHQLHFGSDSSRSQRLEGEEKTLQLSLFL